MLAAERLLEIETKFATNVKRIVSIELDEETLRVVLFLKDGSNLRVTEQWDGEVLRRYSYYWLNSDNEMKIGWDNAPHHTKLNSFPHHKHVGGQKNLHPSQETDLDDVMRGLFLEEICPTLLSRTNHFAPIILHHFPLIICPLIIC